VLWHRIVLHSGTGDHDSGRGLLKGLLPALGRNKERAWDFSAISGTVC
jgi:hypothetical protein